MDLDMPPIKDFYKQLRPERFSDSSYEQEVLLPREQLDYILSQISINQKQDEFETLAKRFAERLIAPNLIPQVGPTGGGDGKTDFETHSVAEEIAFHWFTPSEYCSVGGKWAFAVSAKSDWLSKITSDVKKIVETQRGYDKIFFITNQKPSSKQKKDKQDSLKNEYGIDVEILDREWILEGAYNQDLLNVVIDSLHLSESYRQKKKLGPRDLERERELKEIEERINNKANYSGIDYLYIEDLLQSALLSRSLERPANEIMGKFDRALINCERVGIPSQTYNILYQKAFTANNWLEMPELTLSCYQHMKELIKDNISVDKIEKLITLYILLRYSPFYGKDTSFKEDEELTFFDEIETKCENLQLVSSKLYLAIWKRQVEIMNLLPSKNVPEKSIKDLQQLLNKALSHLDIPIDSLFKTVENIGKNIGDNSAFEKLLDWIIEKEAELASDTEASFLFYKRGIEKIDKGNYKDALQYLGRTLALTLKSDESPILTRVLFALACVYKEENLFYASNSCLIQVCRFELKKMQTSSLDDSGILLHSVLMLCKNELQIGRITVMWCWYELYKRLECALSAPEEIINESKNIELYLTVRLCLCKNETETLEKLPNNLSRLGFFTTEDCAYGLLGYSEKLSPEFISQFENFEKFYSTMISQPIKDQFFYVNNFFHNEKSECRTLINGCEIVALFTYSEVTISYVEMMFSYLESLFASVKESLMPMEKKFTIEIKPNDSLFKVEKDENAPIIYSTCDIEHYDSERFTESLNEIFAHVFSNAYLSKEDPLTLLEKLYKEEYVQGRVSLIHLYKDNKNYIFGPQMKYRLDEWVKENDDVFPQKDVSFAQVECGKGNVQNTAIVQSVINKSLWDAAGWNGFGYICENPFLTALFYENIEKGKKIFEEWSDLEQNNSLPLRISIIKGFDKDYPFAYKVHITTALNEINVKEETKIALCSRFHKMKAQNFDNLDKICREFFKSGELTIVPIGLNNGIPIPCNVSSLPQIRLRNFVVRNAWEIGPNDVDVVAIEASDNPIIPDGVEAPVLKLLNK